MQLSCSMLITINVDNVGTISNVYWSDSTFFSCEVWCQLGIEITNVQLLFMESYSTPCKRIWIPESGKFCLWNPESEMFCWWNLQSGIFCLWNLDPGYFAFGIRNRRYLLVESGIRDILLVESGTWDILLVESGIRDILLVESRFLAPVVQTLDSAIHRINNYPADKY